MGPARSLTDACDACLRRAYLIAHLAPRIAGLLDRADRRTRPLLGLGDEELIAAVAGPAAADALRFLEDFSSAAARRQVAAVQVGVVCRHAEPYPSSLRELVDAPAALFFVGSASLTLLNCETAVTLVGTRRPSPYGLQVTHMLGRGLGVSCVPVVSGLALGIDAGSHRGCLEGGGLPVAVLAGGPDVAYPRSNRRLYRQVRERGLVLSEMPSGRRAFRWSFPARNRLMAALGAMTVVVEAADPSGSLITAEFAQDLGRPVGAVPGRVTSRAAAGTNALLRDGAAVVRSPQDVLDELFGVGARRAELSDRTAELPAELRRVLDAVEGGAGIDRIAEAAGLSAGETRAALSRLEAGGCIVRVGLGSYERSP